MRERTAGQRIDLSVGSTRITVTNVPITRLPDRVGVLVSSDDNLLSHGGGVSGALWNAAGPELALQIEADPPRLSVGDIYRSPAFRLNADWILHLVTLDLDTQTALEPSTLESTLKHLFFEAAVTRAREIAIPVVGAGAAGLDPREVVRSIATAVEFLADLPVALRHVIVSAPRHFDLAAPALQSRLSSRDSLEDMYYRFCTEPDDRESVENPWWQARELLSFILPFEMLDTFERTLTTAAAAALRPLRRRVEAGECSESDLVKGGLPVESSQDITERADLVRRITDILNKVTEHGSLEDCIVYLKAACSLIGAVVPATFATVLHDAVAAFRALTDSPSDTGQYHQWEAITSGLRALIDLAGTNGGAFEFGPDAPPFVPNDVTVGGPAGKEPTRHPHARPATVHVRWQSATERGGGLMQRFYQPPSHHVEAPRSTYSA